MKINKMCC